MTNFAKLKAVAAVSAACAALFGATSAHAYVYAVSHLAVQNLTIGVTDAAGTLNPATVNSYTFNQANTASMNGGPSASSAACNSFGFPACSVVSPVLDAGAVNAAGSQQLRTNNNFAFLGTNQVNSYSGADSVINTATLVQGVPTSLEQIAESLLNTNGFAQAGAEQQSNTSLTTVFSVTGSSNLYLNFDADADQESSILGALGGYLSQSNLNVSFTLTAANGGGSISWAPKGTVGNDCVISTGTLIGAGVTCNEIADTQNLNFNTSTSVNPSTNLNSFDTADIFSHFGLGITGLLEGTYTLALNAVTSTSIVRNVPEPDALALMGIALAGLAFTTKRRGRKQA